MRRVSQNELLFVTFHRLMKKLDYAHSYTRLCADVQIQEPRFYLTCFGRITVFDSKMGEKAAKGPVSG